jgi:hypothetical protein
MKTNENKPIERDKTFVFVDIGILDSMNSVINSLFLQIKQYELKESITLRNGNKIITGKTPDKDKLRGYPE